MLELILLQFSKRENSTLIPTAAELQGGTSIQISLKGGCDILNPTFVLNSENIPAGNNYAYVPSFNRYYFITGMASVRNNMVEITARVDVLGSWKDAIQSISAFVAYDVSANTEVVDRRLSVKTSSVITMDSQQMPGSSSAGTCIVMLQGEGNVGAFDIPLGNLDKLTDGVYTKVDSDLNSLIQSIEEFWKYFIKQVASQGQAGDNIKGAYWYPWIFTSSFDQLVYPLKLGTFETQYGGTRIVEMVKWNEAVMEIPWQFSDWRNNEPYTHLYLYIPYIGTIKLPTSDLIGEEYLTVQIGVNRINGNMAVNVERQNGATIYSGSGNTGYPLPVGSANINTGAIAGGIIAGAAAAVAGVASGNALAAIGGLGAIAGAGIEGLLPNVSSTFGGGGGAASVLSDRIRLYCVTHDTNVAPSSVSAIMGTPTMATKSLSGISGYVQTVGASVRGNMMDVERSQINTYLDRGIYIE